MLEGTAGALNERSLHTKISIIHLSHALGRNVRANNLKRAGSIFAYLAEIPGWLDFGLERTITLIGGGKDEDATLRGFLEMLLLRRDVSSGNLLTIKKILDLGIRTGQAERVFREISTLATAKNLPSPYYSNLDLLANAVPLGFENARLVGKLKYPEKEAVRPEAIERISRAVIGRMALLPGLADRLFAASGQPEVHRDRWMEDLREAFAVDNVTADWTVRKGLLVHDESASEFPFEGLDGLLDIEATRSGFESLRAAKGTLFACFHGGFLNLYCEAFSVGAPNGLTFSITDGARFISVKNPKAALYRGVRAIDDGRPILMAADARVGTYSSTIRVLGTEVRVADGAPFIAYETGCNTVWLAIERAGEKFIPKFVQGPLPRDGEKFAAFRERWFSFYSDQINGLLRGNPRNMLLTRQVGRCL